MCGCSSELPINFDANIEETKSGSLLHRPLLPPQTHKFLRRSCTAGVVNTLRKCLFKRWKKHEKTKNMKIRLSNPVWRMKNPKLTLRVRATNSTRDSLCKGNCSSASKIESRSVDFFLDLTDQTVNKRLFSRSRAEEIS